MASLNPDAPAFVPKHAPQPTQQQQQPTTRVYLQNLHRLVTDDELAQAATAIASFAPRRAGVVFMGPKSSGCAELVYETPELAAKAAELLDGKAIRKLPVHASLTPLASRPAVHKLNPKRHGAPYAEELNYVQQQFGDGFAWVQEAPPVEVRVAMRMPDDFPFEISDQSLLFHVVMPESYPNEPCSITIRNEEFPQRLRSKIDTAVRRRAEAVYKGNAAMASGLLRWIRNNAEKLLTDDLLTEEHHTGLRIVTPPHCTSGPAATGIEDDPSLQGGVVVPLSAARGTDDDDSSSSDEAPELATTPTAPSAAASDAPSPLQQFPTSTAHKGTQLFVHNIKLSGLGVVTCNALSLVCTCGRCKQQTEVTLQPGQHQTIECSRCHSAFSLTFRPEMLHEANHILGYIDNDGCRPLDVLPSSFVATCLGCSADVPFTALQFATPYDFVCRECHAHCSLCIERCGFTVVRPVTVPEQRASRHKKPKDPREAGIRVGTQLPDKGTCRHCKRSYRWLRFPCCGRAFPCDLCHDEASDHPHEFATRMLCGFCSKEQPFSATKPCVHCGLSPTGGQSQAFWEGGRGCRDRSKMSRKDSKKFSGSGKTQSASKSSVAKRS